MVFKILPQITSMHNRLKIRNKTQIKKVEKCLFEVKILLISSGRVLELLFKKLLS